MDRFVVRKSDTGNTAVPDLVRHLQSVIDNVPSHIDRNALIKIELHIYRVAGTQVYLRYI